MLKNYFTVALRNLLRYKAYSVLNIAGLSVGIAASILILLWVEDERSFDSFHSASKEIYRITADISGVKVALTPPPMAEALRSEMTEAVNVTQAAITGCLVTIDDQNFDEQRVFCVDPSFLEMFDFPLSKGDVKTALSTPNGLLLTEDQARKYFGNDDPVGKIIQINKQQAFTVTGTLKNIPTNSHLQFDILLPLTFLTNTDDYKQNYKWDYYSNIYTYVQLASQIASDPAALDNTAISMNAIFNRYEKNMKASFALQPLLDVHLKSDNLMADVDGHGEIQYVRIFSLVSIFILIVASINFMNLATARAARRAKEIGTRKVLGAYSRQVFGQFIGESMLISVISLLFAVLLVILALPSFNQLTEKNLALTPEADLVFKLLAIATLIGLLAGAYPAFYLSSFKPIQSLKGTFKAGAKSILFRNSLVVVQFAVTILLIVATGIVFQQLQFIRNQNLGFDRENILYVTMKGEMFPYYRALRAAFEASTLAENFSFTSDLPNNVQGGTIYVDWEGKNDNEQPVFGWMFIDEHFLGIANVKLLAGRGFSREFTADSSNYIVNEMALKVMGMDLSTAVGSPLSVNNKRGIIIGVVRDFHTKSLQQEIEPLIIEPNTFGGFTMVKTRPEEIRPTIQELKRIFAGLPVAYPFEYGFLDQALEAQYKIEKKISTISRVFAGLAIFIGALGLFGLSAFMNEQRVKEIGVRKVLGATVNSIVILLSSGFVRLLILALALATPLAWYLMDAWLQNYAYHIEINPWIFIVAGIMALFIALLATGFQTIKAALTNPVNSLRNE